MSYPPDIPLPYNPMMAPQHPHIIGASHGALPSPGSATLHTPRPAGAPPPRDLGSVPPELTASRESFHSAMGKPSEFFVDVM